MGYAHGDSGECYKCGTDTEVVCDECGRFVCNKAHSSRILIDAKSFIDLCNDCKKKLRPGARVGGVRITPQMLSTEWHQVRNIRT